MCQTAGAAGPPSRCRLGRDAGAHLRAAREVINERGYEAANFQAIASRAGLSRPTMHYYFHTREEIYDCLVAEAYSIVSDCIAQAKREDTLLDQLSAFVAAAYRSGFADRSHDAVHHHRPAGIPSLSEPSEQSRSRGPGSAGVLRLDGRRGNGARRDSCRHGRRREWCTCCRRCSSGWASSPDLSSTRNDVAMIAKQLRQLMTHGLLDHQQTGPPMTIAPPVPVAIPVDKFAATLPGLTG